jgi:hypothetical protein
MEDLFPQFQIFLFLSNIFLLLNAGDSIFGELCMVTTLWNTSAILLLQPTDKEFTKIKQLTSIILVTAMVTIGIYIQICLVDLPVVMDTLFRVVLRILFGMYIPLFFIFDIVMLMFMTVLMLSVSLRE